MAKPATGTFPAFFSTYINKVEEEDLSTAFANQQELMNSFFDAIPADKHDFSYAPGKWTLKEMLQHIIDTERIFAYRALCIARQEQQNLPGFDEEAYANNSAPCNRDWQTMTTELKLIRQTTEMLFEGFSAAMLQHSGLANHNPITVNAIGFATVGHLAHHIQVIKERYLLA